jgi:hypothetical protein
MTDGTISLTNVATASVTGFRGDIEINAGVVTFTGTNVTEISVAATADDLKTFSATMKRDDLTTLSTAQTAALEFDAAAGNLGDIGLGGGLANLETVTIAGKAGDITISNAPNLTSVTISADAFDLTMSDNDNMTSVSVNGAKFHDVNITDMADLTSLTLDHTTKLPEVSTTASADEKAASMSVTTNASLTSLTISADDIDALTVTGNAALATVDFTGMTDDGSAASTAVAIYNNNLAVQLVKDGYNDTTQDSTYVQYTSTDSGAMTSTSGISTLKTYLDAVVAAASATSGVYVFVDQIDKYEVQGSANGVYTDTAVPTAPSVTTEATANSSKTSIYAVVAKQGAESTTSGTEVRETQTVIFPVTHNTNQVQNTSLGGKVGAAVDGIVINAAGLSKSFIQGATAAGSTVASLVAYVNGDTAWGSELTISAENAGYLRSNQTVNYTYGNGTAGSLSSAEAAGNLWYNLGTTTISGVIALVNADTAARIAVKLATAISAATGRTHGEVMYNARPDGANVVITNAVSIATYPDDITPWASSIPQITFNISTLSTTAGFGGTGYVSNTTGNGYNGTSGFFLNTTKNDVAGIAVTVKNNNKGITRLASAVVTSHNNGKVSGTIGAIGEWGSTSQTSTGLGVYTLAAQNDITQWNTNTGASTGTGYVSTMIVSGTHFTSGESRTSKVALFALISDTTTSTDQAAAVTDRTGWL